VSQPSLSQQIQKLEQELGERLFTRLKRRAVPTPAGLALMERAARILREVEEAHRDAADSRTEVGGTVNLGVLPTIAPHLLPQVMLRLRREFPAIEVIVHENTTTSLLAQSAACELDLAVVSLPIPDDRFTIETLFTEELLLAVPPQHKLAKRRQVKLGDVEAEPFILLQEGHCLGDQALRFCDRQKCHPPVIFRTSQLETIQALVAAGIGVSLIPHVACQSDRTRQPVYISLAEPRPQRAIAVLWRKEHPPGRAARALLDVMRSSFGKPNVPPRAKAKAARAKSH
jgi:LysR family hydrogen peroxide-inducible transcriptional activator